MEKKVIVKIEKEKNVIDIYDLIYDEKYWEVDTYEYYTHHMYRNSPYETCDDCGNCDGARCEGCEKIRETELRCSIPSDELYDMLISKGVDKDTASDFAYQDNCNCFFRNGFHFYWPTGYGLWQHNPEFYKKIVGDAEIKYDAEIKQKVLKEKENSMKSMKKVTGSVYASPLRESLKFLFEFFVPDDMTDEQIRVEIKKKFRCYISFETEAGYELMTDTVTKYDMKKVTGVIAARPLDSECTYSFEFFVPDDMTDEQIGEVIKHEYDSYIIFDTEDGYEEVTETVTKYERVY